MTARLFDEFRNAARSVAKRPAFSVLIVGVLAAGPACVIFTLAMVNGFVIRPMADSVSASSARSDSAACSGASCSASGASPCRVLPS